MLAKKRGMGICLGDNDHDCLTKKKLADDVLLFASSKEQLQNMLCDFKRSTEKVGLRIHPGKTKILSNQSSNIRKDIEIEDIKVEILTREESTKYLGQMTTFQQQETTEIRNRIRAWATFLKYRQELTSRNNMLRHRLRLFDAVVSLTMNYASGTWTLTKEHERMIQSTHRKMLRFIIQTKRRYKKIEKRKDKTIENDDTTEWKYVRRQILKEDPNCKLDDETLQTLLMKIIPNDFVKSMRELLTQGRYINDYHGFEQALFDEISTRKMDEDAGKGSPGIHAVGSTTELLEQENVSPHLSKMTSNTRQCTSGARSGSATSVDWHLVNVTAADQGAGEEMKKNNIRRKRDHLTSFRKLEKAPKVEGVPEVHAGRAEDLTSRENALMRQPVKAITLSPQRGHRGDQAHFQDHRQPNGSRGFRNPREMGKAKAKTKEAKEI